MEELTNKGILSPDVWKYIFGEETEEFLLKRKLSEFDKSINPLLDSKDIDLERFDVEKTIADGKVYGDNDTYYNCGNIIINEKGTKNFIECSLTPEEIKYSMYYEYDNYNRFSIIHKCDRDSETIFLSSNGENKDESVLYDLGENTKISTVSNLKHIGPKDLQDLYGIIDGATIVANRLFNSDTKKYTK